MPSKYPFNIIPSGSGINYALIRNVSSASYPVYSGNLPIGTATEVDLVTGVSKLGEFLRLGRKQGESDTAFLGRIQRVLISNLLKESPGTERSVNLSLSAILGRVTLSTWAGNSSSLPSATCLELIDYPGLDATVDTNSQSLVPCSNQSYANTLVSGYSSLFQCQYNISSYDAIYLTAGTTTLAQGIDYLIGTDPTTILLKTPIPSTVNLTLELYRYRPLRVSYSGDIVSRSARSLTFKSFPSVYSQQLLPVESPVFETSLLAPSVVFTPVETLPSLGYSGLSYPVFYSNGIQTFSIPSSLRFILEPGNTERTLLGTSLFTKGNPTWSTVPVSSTFQYGPSMDLGSI